MAVWSRELKSVMVAMAARCHRAAGCGRPGRDLWITAASVHNALPVARPCHAAGARHG
jgi:hypothetical protein